MTEQKHCPEFEALEQILINSTAQVTATRLQDLGFDAQRTIEKLPEIMEALQKQTNVLDAFCTSVDCWSEDVGGEPLPSDLLPTLGPPNEDALDLLQSCREDPDK